jgi:hypothetical protein
MDDSSSGMSISLPIGAAGQSRASIWHAARPVLVFDPEFLPPMRSRLRIGIGRFLCRTPVIWVGAVIVGAVVGGTMALTNPLVYSATGLLLGLGRDEMAAQGELAIIRSDEVMRGVVDRLGVLRVAPGCVGDGAAIGCAVRAVQSRIQAQIVGDPNGIESSLMLRLTAIHPDPAIAVAMLDAAVAIDRKIWHAAHVADRADALDPQLAAAQGALDQTLADVAGVRTQAHVTDIAQDLRQAAAEANMIARQDSDLRLRQVAVSAELKAAQSALQTTPETVLDSREVSSGDPGQDARTLLLQLKLQRAHMAQLYARDYPGLAELDHKIETVETAMKMQAKSTTSVTRDVRNPVLVVLSTKAAALVSENAGLVQQRQELQRQFNGPPTHAECREFAGRGSADHGTPRPAAIAAAARGCPCAVDRDSGGHNSGHCGRLALWADLFASGVAQAVVPRDGTGLPPGAGTIGTRLGGAGA